MCIEVRKRQARREGAEEQRSAEARKRKDGSRVEQNRKGYAVSCREINHAPTHKAETDSVKNLDSKPRGYLRTNG